MNTRQKEKSTSETAKKSSQNRRGRKNSEKSKQNQVSAREIDEQKENKNYRIVDDVVTVIFCITGIDFAVLLLADM